ncbi:MAG: hypothetical protein II363_01880 [Clostridia bacterium]|nr:hypothetical protein [Clostridia bacterium]
MKKSLSFWQFAGFVFTCLAGTLLHFFYDWSGQNLFVALFSGVNESVWEHMKLLFFPLFAFALFESRHFAKEYENFWCVKLIGILLGISLIAVLYYTYTGALGVSADWFNITIFFIAAAATYRIETKLMKSDYACRLSPAASFGFICLLAVLFFVFTFAPPYIPLFQDPVTKTYGIPA